MRRQHFELLKPRCPSCLEKHREVAVELARLIREEDGVILEGFLACPSCGRSFPILDGVPILVAEVEQVIRSQISAFNARRDLSSPMADFLAHCCGSENAFQANRYHLSIYARDHYGDLDPLDRDKPAAGSAVKFLVAGLEALSSLGASLIPGPALDVGCSVGRTSFEIAARLRRPVLGVDLNFSMLRLAHDVLHRGHLSYPRRLEGTHHETRSFDALLPGRELVDFWFCNAEILPFPARTFTFANHLNVLDCVASPHNALVALERVLAAGGYTLIATPFDWSPLATPIESWLGGHSQRGVGAGRAEPVLRALLGGHHPAALTGLRIVAEPEMPPWHLRLDDRHGATYQSHLAIARRQD